jgi:hypothetical protein
MKLETKGQIARRQGAWITFTGLICLAVAWKAFRLIGWSAGLVAAGPGLREFAQGLAAIVGGMLAIPGVLMVPYGAWLLWLGLSRPAMRRYSYREGRGYLRAAEKACGRTSGGPEGPTNTEGEGL